MNSKTRSEIAIIVSVICLFINFLTFLLVYIFKSGILPNIETAIASILLAMSPSLPFCPVYVSVWIDKLLELRKLK
jgi:hypothetical protein